MAWISDRTRTTTYINFIIVCYKIAYNNNIIIKLTIANSCRYTHTDRVYTHQSSFMWILIQIKAFTQKLD